ncbi:hypothetical protein [Paraburkholderia sp. 40]|uniref:hypothetical protein n=1 Tax=unclassified Paraburkholderia TaxID=2615204 RepID=UPI003D1DA982
MSDEINRRRRRLLGSVAIGAAALNLGLNGWANAQSVAGDTNGSAAPRPTSFATIKQIDAGVLNIGTQRTIGGGIGHNLPQEAPQAFAEAIIDVARY